MIEKIKLKKRFAPLKRPDRKLDAQDYRMGGDGFGWWVEDHVWMPIYPEGEDIAVRVPMHSLPNKINPDTGRSYKSMWEQQKRIMREALRMENKRFIYKLIVLCWQRGEGKSALACLIQLWKFFNWPRQFIALGANSKEQIRFVHYDIMRDIIVNSPKLLAQIGEKNVQEKEIRLQVKGRTTSAIVARSTATGILSNITGYSFSEMFDMKNPKFFTQLDGSIRNVPNALGVIDSTVSDKTHILYQLYDKCKKGELKSVFFSHRYSEESDPADYMHPLMDKKQLDEYRNKFLDADFERYFKNIWEAGKVDIFTPDIVEAMKYVGVDNELGRNYDVIQVIRERKDNEAKREKLLSIDPMADTALYEARINKLQSRLVPIDRFYKLKDGYGKPAMASVVDIQELTEVLDTNWCVQAGLDRAEPMKTTTSAQTILTAMIKGLPGSRSMPPPVYLSDSFIPNYIYFYLLFQNIESSSLEDIKLGIGNIYGEYNGIDSLCMEKWGVFDLTPWCQEKAIPFEIVSPTYNKQREVFSELFTIAKDGRIKAPDVGERGQKMNNLLDEQLLIFHHDKDKKFYGSPEKDQKRGIQDDGVYSSAYCIFGGRELGVQNFREIKGEVFMGLFIENDELIGKY